MLVGPTAPPPTCANTACFAGDYRWRPASRLAGIGARRVVGIRKIWVNYFYILPVDLCRYESSDEKV
jgi:hypothetical protein